MNKIIRTVCIFDNELSQKTLDRVKFLSQKLAENGFEIQTKRVCTQDLSFSEAESLVKDSEVIVSLGNYSVDELSTKLDEFYQTDQVYLNVDLSTEKIDQRVYDLLFAVINNKPGLTFNFTFSFNVPPSSPFFPSSYYEQNGFSVGLQSTDLAEDCGSLAEWFENQKAVWNEIMEIFKNDPDFLGIDSSIAPFDSGKSSLVNFVKKLGYEFRDSVITDLYTQMTQFIKKENPKPVGLCGLMFPALEDFELTDEYELGEFSLERNVFLSLHSGLGIDTYPIGMDEKPEKVLGVLKLIQALSKKYQKPLSCRFVSDGKAKIGEQTDFKNQYLKDVKVRPL